jgi:sugar phosphate isomerase/epimerase
MKIGCPSHPRKDIIDELTWIGENGFEFVDLCFEEAETAPEKIDTDSVKKTLEKYSLGAIGHTAWYFPIGSPSKAMREAAIKELTRYIDVFSQIGCPYVTIHAHWFGAMFSVKECISFQIDSLQKLIEIGKNRNIGILYEPVNTEMDSLENVAAVLDALPELHFHIDIGHAHLFKRKPVDFLNPYASRLKHIHLHDNDGKKDLHLPLGCGKTDWKQAVRDLKKSSYDGTITLEVFSGIKEYVLISKRMLEEIWYSEET